MVEGAVGSAQGDGAVGFEGEGPAAFVDVVVVAFTDRQQIVQVRGAEVFPPGDVVDAAVLEPHLTAREPTGPVHHAQGAALVGGGEAAGSSHVEGDTVVVEGDGGDGGVAAVAAHRLHRERVSVCGFAHRVVVAAVTQGVGIDEEEMSGTRRPVVRAPVINPTKASALKWSNSTSSPCSCDLAAATAASNAAAMRASVSGSTWRWV